MKLAVQQNWQQNKKVWMIIEGRYTKGWAQCCSCSCWTHVVTGSLRERPRGENERKDKIFKFVVWEMFQIMHVNFSSLRAHLCVWDCAFPRQHLLCSTFPNVVMMGKRNNREFSVCGILCFRGYVFMNRIVCFGPVRQWDLWEVWKNRMCVGKFWSQVWWCKEDFIKAIVLS